MNSCSKSVKKRLLCAVAGAILISAPIRSFAVDPATNNPAATTIPPTAPGGALEPVPVAPKAEVAQPKTVQQLFNEYSANSKKLDNMLPQDVMTDAAKRKEIAPKAIPVAFHNLDLISQLAETKKVAPAAIDQWRMHSEVILYVLDDTATVSKVKDMLDSQDDGRQIEAKMVQLSAQWMTLKPEDKAAASKVADDVETLDKAHPKNNKLTGFTMSFAYSTKDDALSDRFESMVTHVLTSPSAQQYAQQKKHQDEVVGKMKAAYVDKPLVIAGKTVDGKDFTTADWKGKVVLVDFWAVWCGPCVASLPHLKEQYAKYHDQGLEILGVDNDMKADVVTSFTEKQKMNWTQLFKPSEDPRNRFSQNTLQFGIEGIPTMFIIDKKGVCRSVEAREKMDDLIPKLLAE